MTAAPLLFPTVRGFLTGFGLPALVNQYLLPTERKPLPLEIRSPCKLFANNEAIVYLKESEFFPERFCTSHFHRVFAHLRGHFRILQICLPWQICGPEPTSRAPLPHRFIDSAPFRPAFVSRQRPTTSCCLPITLLYHSVIPRTPRSRRLSTLPLATTVVHAPSSSAVARLRNLRFDH